MYEYNAVVKSIYDADTITVDIDLGFYTWLNDQKVRLYGINAPEVRGEEKPEGLRSRDWVREHMPIGSRVRIQTVKSRLKGKYGRWLARIVVDEGDLSWILNDELVERGLAKVADY